jgi:DNA polymerase/3'-5' exonuclease PolX
MELNQAKLIADKYVAALAPLCERIEIAGSIRRRKPQVNDIEIVCIPRGRDMYGFVTEVNKLEKAKGEPTGKYTQRYLPEGIKLDLFMANKDNWGMILAIRTGSADFSHQVLAVGWTRRGYKSKDGVLIAQDGNRRYIREEEDLFDLIGVSFVDPIRREFRQ